MKKFVSLILILSFYTVFSQSFAYSLDNSSSVNKNTGWDGINTYHEYLYFSAYVLPVSESHRLQEALDTHKIVRLEKGVYTSKPIVMKQGQRLYGYPTITKLNTTVTIKAGSTKIRILNMEIKDLIFEPGALISDNYFKTLRFTPLSCTNCTMENNTFVNIDRSSLRFDCSSAGYFRNNKFIRVWSHTRSPQTVMKGNSTTPSYGNVVLWRNYLFASGDATQFDNLESLTLVGVDAESWNYRNEGSKALLHMRKMGDVRIGGFSGLNHGNYPTPTYDIEAKNLTIFGKDIYSKSKNDIVRPGTNVMMLSGRHEAYSFDNTSSSLNFMAYYNDNDLFMNGKKVTSTLPSSYGGRMEDMLIDQNVKTWDRPYFGKIPNPVSAARMSARSGKKDQSAQIQSLIDRDGIAELEEGIYYISKPLVITEGQGIIGKGSGKTAIVGIKDDFALIHATNNTDQGKGSIQIHLAHMTLQGGKTGLYVSPLKGSSKRLQLSACTFKNLIFRNQKNGMHFDRFYGVDNNFFDKISFVDCQIGVFQEPDPNFDVYKGETNSMMYMDKNVFFKCQIIRCGIGFSMLAKRPNNLNAWIDCKFDGNGIAVDMEKAINPIFANCDFKNNRGEYIVGRDDASSFYNCNFSGNRAQGIFKLRKTYIEGCNFADNAPLFSHPTGEGFIMNSTSSGGLGTMKHGILVNNTFRNDEELNFLVLELQDRRLRKIVDRKSNPKPQYLVTKK